MHFSVTDPAMRRQAPKCTGTITASLASPPVVKKIPMLPCDLDRSIESSWDGDGEGEGPRGLQPGEHMKRDECYDDEPDTTRLVVGERAAHPFLFVFS